MDDQIELLKRASHKKWESTIAEIKKEVSSTHSWKLTHNAHGFKYFKCTICKLEASTYIEGEFWSEIIVVTDNLPCEGWKGIRPRLTFTCEQYASIKKENDNVNKVWSVYILDCILDHLYTGITNNLYKRFYHHTIGKASKFTRMYIPIQYVYIENCNSKSEALKREYQIKQLSKEQKLELIKGFTVPSKYNMRRRK